MPRRRRSSTSPRGAGPIPTLEENALFLEGECYFFDDQYGKAEDAYDMLLKKHGNTRYLDTVIVADVCHRPLLGSNATRPIRTGR